MTGTMTGMEAAVLSAAVSGILKIVGSKLAPLLIKEYSSIVGVKKDLQELHTQVLDINNWLEKAGYYVTRNNPSSSWLEELKDVAYAVDDVVDEFQLKAEKNEVYGDGGIVSKYMYTKPKSVIFQCKAASKVKEIKKRFAAIVKQRSDFSAITNSVPVEHPGRHQNKKTGESLPIVDEASVLGRDQEKHQIISKLIETNDPKEIKTFSIIGLGGSGKTTLAKVVFDDGTVIKKHFQVTQWVHVSQEFDVEELIKKLFEAISGEKSERYPLQQMSKTILGKLTGKRFLLVLDDVWTEDRIKWEEFKVHLKKGAPGSAILLTTRNRKVAETVGSTDPFDLPSLSEDDSWKLFQQRMPAKGLEVGFKEVAKDIMRKCGGLPLAIIVLASVLHGKKRIEQWETVRDNNLLDVEGEEHRVSACLMLSYLNLPSHLKQCFTICSVFLKGCWIDKEQLIDQWIAHDMITPVDDVVNYFEGYECFNYLVQMAFLQDVQELHGRVICTMHDVVHEFARSILGGEISKEPASSTKNCRYFSLTEWPRHHLPKNYFEKARAIYVNQGDNITFGKALKNARHLRSIIVKNMSTEAVPNAMFQLKNLKYLEISGLRCFALPEAISNVWSLQALHIPDSDIVRLPESIGRLQKLRTLNLSACRSLESLPDSIGDCHMISTIDLQHCYSLPVLPNSIGGNKKLRVLRLGCTKIEWLPSSIATLENLHCLDLWMCRNLVELPECIGDLKKLEVLDLEGCKFLRAMPVGIGQLTRLQTMSLFVVGEGEKSARISELGNAARISENLTIRGIQNVIDPDDAHQACLKQKTNLQRLDLQWDREVTVHNDEKGRKVHRWPIKIDLDNVNTELEQAVLDGLEPPSGIQVLKIMRYSGRQYARWMLKQAGGGAQGAPQFTCLKVMELSFLRNIKHLEGLVELPCLEELELYRMFSLESISGGPFPLLVKLTMNGLDCLREVWIVTERTLAGGEEGGGCGNHLGQLQIGSCLSHLTIRDCPELIVKPYLPSSLEYLELYGSKEQRSSLGQGSSWSSSSQPSFSFSHLKELHLGCGWEWELLQYIATLESLTIEDCGNGLRKLLKIEDCDSGLTELPESMQRLTSLRSLKIWRCSKLCMLPEWLGELRSLQKMDIFDCNSMSSLPQSLSHLTSLQRLRLRYCDALHQLPEWLGELRSLREFMIVGLPGLSCLPQSMCRLTSLEWLHIEGRTSIKSLPEWIKGLAALRILSIRDCPDLGRRYQRGKGEDWHLVSHVRRVNIWDD
ncbi:disease resistance protein RGA2-like [Phragmites australis]|uniref:disease resistance protein RGA2-like n=1 Tax=Phragmites australis TaxID=29695 RepID=UPI002D79C67B|nr:disease resistance protein RGA2-like [Phragmites australis]